MVMIKFGEDGHMSWPKFKCRSMDVDDVAFFFVEDKVNGFDLTGQCSMASAFKIAPLACKNFLM